MTVLINNTVFFGKNIYKYILVKGFHFLMYIEVIKFNAKEVKI